MVENSLFQIVAKSSIGLLLLHAILANHHSVVAVVGLQSQLLTRLAALLAQLVDLGSEDSLGLRSGVDAVGLDRDDEPAARLQKVVGVDGDDAGLVRLRHVGKDHVDHADEHAVPQGLTSVLHDGNDVGAAFGLEKVMGRGSGRYHVGEVARGAVGELDSVDHASGPDHVGDVRNSGAVGSTCSGKLSSGKVRHTQVEHLGADLDGHVGDTADDGGTQLGAEGVPHTVLVIEALPAVEDGDDGLAALLGDCAGVNRGLADGGVGGVDLAALEGEEGVQAAAAAAHEELLAGGAVEALVLERVVAGEVNGRVGGAAAEAALRRGGAHLDALAEAEVALDGHASGRVARVDAVAVHGLENATVVLHLVGGHDVVEDLQREDLADEEVGVGLGGFADD
ncbi:amino acid adenylation domain-containing protein [Babesia caballi]|uniref:Amino acid adenylation domain-containing protein n=1 Tax=Babesia caballi TaxID=5871 RepID=A0AAV4LN06_BABCB|nr:amino acid adenylation domain-containing protein [Babesia caballi]